MLNEKWKHILINLDHAFQPIVNPHTGRTFAFEALLRGVECFNFPTIASFFDAAFEENCLFTVVLELRKKLIKKFIQIPFHQEVKLFYNYDYRVKEMDDENFNSFTTLFYEYNLKPDMLCIEISEKNKVESINDFTLFLNAAKKNRFNIALDDFGAGYAGLEIFYYSDPNFLKFDRFLIKDIDLDIKKKTFSSHILHLTKLLGIFSIAEGIENEKEYFICKEIGFELIQGYFIQKPTQDVSELKLIYKDITSLNYKKRKRQNVDELISKEIIRLDTININDNLSTLLSKFRKQNIHTFFPVVDSNDYPLGIIHEKKIRPYIYSRYGQDILKYKKIIDSFESIITKYPILDINTKHEKILEVFVNNPESEGVIIATDNKYAGFLTAKSLLNILNEKNIKEARELNPLTKLPGNILINKYLIKILKRKKSIFYIIYFDFDYFKPFNDRFGFRQGDRAIILFSELLKKKFYQKNCFIGHIGGDDFFLGIEYKEVIFEKVIKKIEKIIKKFSQTVSTFYTKEEIEAKCYHAKDRSGALSCFPLLSVTVVIIEILKGERKISKDKLIFKLTELKKEAKASGNKIFTYRLSSDMKNIV